MFKQRSNVRVELERETEIIRYENVTTTTLSLASVLLYDPCCVL